MIKEEAKHIAPKSELPPGAEAGKKTYEKAELTIHGDLKEITGGEPAS